jgi:thiosulfate dehydrogenase [quinone] large subunit
MNPTDGSAATGTVHQARGSSGPGVTSAPTALADTLREKPALSMIGLLIVEMIIGYEWLMSGLVKIVRGDFPAGLADALLEKSAGVPEWYASLMKSFVIPNAEAFGYVIEVAELLAGIALIAGPLIWLFAWERVSDRLRSAVLFFTAAAALGSAFLAINLHIANGATHFWLLPGDSFDEGIDLDSVLPAISVVIAAVSLILLRRLRRGAEQS